MTIAPLALVTIRVCHVASAGRQRAHQLKCTHTVTSVVCQLLMEGEGEEGASFVSGSVSRLNLNSSFASFRHPRADKSRQIGTIQMANGKLGVCTCYFGWHCCCHRVGNSASRLVTFLGSNQRISSSPVTSRVSVALGIAADDTRVVHADKQQ